MDPGEEMPAEPVEDRLVARTRAAVLAAGRELLVERRVQGIAVEDATPRSRRAFAGSRSFPRLPAASPTSDKGARRLTGIGTLGSMSQAVRTESQGAGGASEARGQGPMHASLKLGRLAGVVENALPEGAVGVDLLALGHRPDHGHVDKAPVPERNNHPRAARHSCMNGAWNHSLRRKSFPGNKLSHKHASDWHHWHRKCVHHMMQHFDSPHGRLCPFRFPGVTPTSATVVYGTSCGPIEAGVPLVQVVQTVQTKPQLSSIFN